MGVIADAFNQWQRNNVVDGDPTSGVNPPSKAEGRAIGALTESYIAAQVTAAAAAGGAIEIIRDVTTATGAVGAGAAKDTFRLPHAMALSEVRASLSGASSSGDVTIDVNAGGVSVFSAVLHVDEGETTSVGSLTPFVLTTLNMVDDTEITIDVDGAGMGATGLRVTLIGARSDFGAATMPFYVGEAGSSGSTGTALNVAYPSGLMADDIAIIQMATWTSDIAANFIRPSGWNTLVNPTDDGPVTSFGIDYTLRTAMFWRRLDGTETGHQVVTADAYAGTWNAVMSIWRGCVQSGNPYEALATNHGHGSIMAGQDTTTLGASRRVVTLYSASFTFTSGPDTGWTELFNIAYTPNGDQFCASAQAVPLSGTLIAAETRSRAAPLLPMWASASFALLPG